MPREVFIGSGCERAAYLDTALPIECGQTISQPFIVAYMTEKLGVAARSRVLEIGTGSGYQAAVLARLCRHVYTIERHGELLLAGQAAFRGARHRQYHRHRRRRLQGLAGAAPFRPHHRHRRRAWTSPSPRAQLEPDGRMILPMGRRLGRQRLVLVTMTPDGTEREDLIAVRFVPLVTENN